MESGIGLKIILMIKGIHSMLLVIHRGREDGVHFEWPSGGWNDGVLKASMKRRGKHLMNISYRILLASIVYLIWQERNLRLFNGKKETPKSVASHTLNLVKNRLITLLLKESFQSLVIKRVWKIAW
ncbi:hypothetical protein BUALT_Bualt10G0048000 [Buddleja alternifolia]|uniref:Reverse transcriptase zinc-binding domain-containing protein n=1 Tax=Buddleja alternifolia TaxID=168488 RepID=A0AAV6X4T5_9LAMI|nr:hypothetical protein BUALT_Bualt10G0048000 [Buddleja alternifolia]